MDYGERIRSLRLTKGISQAEMAEKMGKSLSAYKLWESGFNQPNISALIEMADFYGVTVDFLIGRPTTEERIDVSDFEKKLLPTQRSKYFYMLKAIQRSLIDWNEVTRELYIQDEQLSKIDAIRILSEALRKIHCMPDKIEVTIVRASDKSIIGSSDNNEILIDANVAQRQIMLLQEAFCEIQNTMLSPILNLGLKIKDDSPIENENETEDINMIDQNKRNELDNDLEALAEELQKL